MCRGVLLSLRRFRLHPLSSSVVISLADLSTWMQQNRSICGQRRACSCSITKVLAIYIHLRQTLIGQPAITSVAAGVAAGVAVCCRICSRTLNRLISAADIVSYLMQNSRLLDDICGPVVEVNSGSGAKIYVV